MSWQSKKLGNVSRIVRGGSPRPIKKYLTDDKAGVNWIKIGDATGSNKYIHNTKEKITREGISKSRFVESGTFLLSNSMSFGRPYILKTEGCIHDGWLAIFDYEKELDQTYLFYFLSSSAVQKQCNQLAKGTVVRNLNIELASQLIISYPSLPVQKQIVAKLDVAFAGIDKAINATEKNIENAEALKSSILSQSFSGDLPNVMVNTVKLGDVCELINGRAYKKPELLDKGKYLLLRVGNFFTSDKWYYSDLELDDKKYCNDGDLLYAWSASFGARIWSGGKVIYHYHIWRVDIDDSQIDKKFLFYWFEFDKEKIKGSSPDQVGSLT